MSAGKLVRVLMAPRNEFQPSATGNEWRRARSRGINPRGPRRACTRARISASSPVLVGGGSETYGMRMVRSVPEKVDVCLCHREPWIHVNSICSVGNSGLAEWRTYVLGCSGRL